MSIKKFVISIITTLILYSANGFTELAVEAPIGSWTVQKPHPSGAVIEVQMEINDDHTFNGVALVNNAVNWTYSGIWELSGNELTYTYKESSMELPEHYQDIDYIISVDEGTYISKSKQSGETNTFTRLQ